MYKAKKYGSRTVEFCVFCEKEATKYNSQGMPVCHIHSNSEMGLIRCPRCKSYLDFKTGKFGPYVGCLTCGNTSLSRFIFQYGKFKVVNNG